MFKVVVWWREYDRDSFRDALYLAMQLADDSSFGVQIRDDSGLILQFNQPRS